MGSMVEAEGFTGSFFIGEFKTKKQEFKALEEKKQVAQMVCYQNQLRSPK